MEGRQCPFCGLKVTTHAPTCAACGLPFDEVGIHYRRPIAETLAPIPAPWIRPTPTGSPAPDRETTAALDDEVLVAHLNWVGPLSRDPSPTTSVSTTPAAAKPARERAAFFPIHIRIGRRTVAALAMVLATFGLAAIGTSYAGNPPAGTGTGTGTGTAATTTP